MSPIELNPITSTEETCGPPDELVSPATDTSDIPTAPTGPGIILDPTTHTEHVCGKPSESDPAPTPPLPPPSALLSLGNRVYQFSHFLRVSDEGTMWLLFGRAATSKVALLLDQDVALRGISIEVDDADLNNDYDLEIFARTTGGYQYIDALPLPKGETQAYRINLVDELAAGTGVGLRMNRTSGSGKSAFHHITVSLEMRDV
jgi:hypothetical protein